MLAENVKQVHRDARLQARCKDEKELSELFLIEKVIVLRLYEGLDDILLLLGYAKSHHGSFRGCHFSLESEAARLQFMNEHCQLSKKNSQNEGGNRTENGTDESLSNAKWEHLFAHQEKKRSILAY